jgi:hypothetical protein
VKRFIVFLAAFLFPALAFASGGACPTGANYLNVATNSLVTLSSLGVTSCYYISAAGSDGDNGTTKATAWLYAPGMPNYTGGVTPAAGIGFIFRGGDTWHFGASTAPAVGGTWSWSWSGTSGSPIYIGFDNTWYSGGAWTRPILTGDNPLTPHPGTVGDYVASCAYQIGGSNQLVNLGGNNDILFDNFEEVGLCQSDSGQPFAHDIYLVGSGAQSAYTNLYLHGWTHTNFASCGGAASCLNTDIYLIGSTGHILYNVVDGSDSDPGGTELLGPGNGCYEVAYDVFRYTQQVICTATHTYHDLLVEHWYATVHPNLYESVAETSGNNAFYNLVFRDICTDSGACPVLPLVGFWPLPSYPPSLNVDYIFNMVYYNVGGIIQYFNVGNNANEGGLMGKLIIFNNTFENTLNGQIFGCTPDGTVFPFTAANNHYITDSGTIYSATCASQLTPVTNIAQTHAQATSQGYTASQTFAFSPVSGTVATVNTGTNNQASYCAALATAAVSDPTLSDAASKCGSATTYAVTYNSANHTVTYPATTPTARPVSAAWNVGAYQYNGTSTVATPVISPASGSFTSPQTITITDATAGATLCYTTDGSTPTANGAGSCTHGSTYASGFSQAIPATVKAVGSKSGNLDSPAATNTYTSLSGPAITSASTKSCTVNFPCSYTITATNSPTSFSATGLPSCLSVNTSTGVISGTCTSLATYTGITVGATNGTGTGTGPLTVTVGYFVQATGAKSSSASFPSNVTSGDALYAAAYCGVSPTCTIAFTSPHETWTAPIYGVLSTAGNRIAVACAIASATQADSVSATGNGISSNIGAIQIYEASGTTCNLDTTSSPSGGFVTTDSVQTSPIMSGNITTTTNADLMFTFVANAGVVFGADTWAAGAGYSNLTCVDNSGFNASCATSGATLRTAVEIKALTTVGSGAASITSTAANSQEYGTLYVAFKPKSASTPCPCVLGVQYIPQ